MNNEAAILRIPKCILCDKNTANSRYVRDLFMKKQPDEHECICDNCNKEVEEEINAIEQLREM